MRLCLISNCVSPHLFPLAKCFAELLGNENFRYVSTGEISDARKALGWDNSYSAEWIIYKDSAGKDSREADDWMMNADVVLCGVRDIELLKKRCAKGMVTFYASERWFKPPWGMWRVFHPLYLKMVLGMCSLLRAGRLIYLPIGLYADRDMRRAIKLANCFSKGRVQNFLLWGYFVSKSADFESYQGPSADEVNILWFGRLLHWKRTDLLIKAVKRLKDQVSVRLNVRIIGMGQKLDALKMMVEKYSLSDSVRFEDPMPMEQVRVEIRKADVCVVTSNTSEGWGVAVNEIMLEGRCVVCSDAVGSGTALIKNGVNGLLFKNGSSEDLRVQLTNVIRDRALLNKLASEARLCSEKLWTPEVAASRFFQYSGTLLKNESRPVYSEGPLKEI